MTTDEKLDALAHSIDALAQAIAIQAQAIDNLVGVCQGMMSEAVSHADEAHDEQQEDGEQFQYLGQTRPPSIRD